MPEAPAVTGLKRRLDLLDAEIAAARLGGEESEQTRSLRAARATAAEQLARETAVTTAGPAASDEQVGLVRAQRDADYLRTRLTLLDRAPLYDRLAAMDRDITFKTNRYTAAAAHIAAYDAVAAAPSGVHVVGDVIASDEPSAPHIPAIVGLAAGSSLALGMALAVIAELGRRQVRTRGGPDERRRRAGPCRHRAVGAPVVAGADRVAPPATPLRLMAGWRSRRDSNPRYRLPSTAV